MTSTGRIATCIFDLDGTLVDSAPGIDYASQVAWSRVFPERACPPMRALMGPPISEMFRRVVPEAPPALVANLERIFREAYDGGAWMKTIVHSGVHQALQCLIDNGIRCFGVTNKPSLPTKRILEHCGLSRFFDVFLSPDSRQPAFVSKAAATRSLIEERGIDPTEACFVGDTLDDARAADKCDIPFVAYSQGYGWNGLRSQTQHLRSFDHFNELPVLMTMKEERAEA